MMMKKFRSVPLTRPADARHPLPSGEGFVRNGFLFWTQVRQSPNDEAIPLPLCIDGNPRLVIHDFDLAHELDVPEANQFLNPAFLADSFPKEYITS
jgi:hypothetical protein